MSYGLHRPYLGPTPCICGKRFRSMIAEARHRHNFPLLCLPAKKERAR